MRYNLALFVANALFALNYSLFVAVFESDSLSIGAIYLLQTLVFGVVATVASIAKPNKKTVAAKDAAAIYIIGIVSSLGWSYTTLRGMSLSSPIDAATIASFGPSLTLIFAHFLGSRRLTATRISGVAISLLGVTALALHQFRAGGQHGVGNLLLVFAVVIAAANTLLLKPHLERYGICRVAMLYALAASAVSFPLFAKELDFTPLLRLDSLRLSELIAMLAIGSSLPLLLLFEGTEHLSPLHTSLYRYVQPLTTSIVVVIRGQAELTTINYIALAAIIIGGVLVAKGVDRSG